MMQQFTLHSYVGRDGILHLDIPVGFLEKNLEVALTVQEMVLPVNNTTSRLLRQDDSEETILCREGGVLVADGKLLSDPSDLVQQQRYQRTMSFLQ